MVIKQYTTGIASFFMALCFQTMAIADTPQNWVNTSDTVIAFVGNSGTSLMRDLTGVYTPAINGCTSGSDSQVGNFVQFPTTGTTGLSFNYQGASNVLRGKGFTIEAWIKPESGSLTSGNFVTRVGAFALTFNNSMINLAWLCLPTVPIYVEPGTSQINYYPLSFTCTGTSALTASAWNQYIITYDESRKICRTWVNGVLERDLDVVRDGQQWVNLPAGPFTMFSNLHNAKVAGIRLRAGVFNPATPPAMKAYLTQLPWEGRMVLNIDKIDPSLALPVTITATLPNIGTYSTTLSSWQQATSISIPRPGGAVAIRDMNITATANGTQVFSKTLSYVNNPPTTPLPAGGVTVNSDKSISKDGVKIFPRFMYHVLQTDLPTVKSMGFNITTPKSPTTGWNMPAYDVTSTVAFANASGSNGLYLTVLPRYTDSAFSTYMNTYKSLAPVLFWYAADEPWGAWDSIRAIYNNTMLADSNHPSMTTINNPSHTMEGATTCDVIACDPYPLPNVSLRTVVDSTLTAIQGSYGLKPVWTILDAYNGKMPNLDEMRCMAFLALCAGANGIGVYSWDDRVMSGGVLTGYYMPTDYPEALPVVSEVMQDLEDLEPVLVEQNVPNAVTVNPEQPALHAAIKIAGDRAYLFVANDSRQAVTGTIVLAPGHTVTANPLPQSGYSQPLQFTSGTCQITFPALGAGLFELQWPYGGAPVALPGRIEAENFDLGGEGVGYHDTTSGNYGNKYRNTDVDITTTGDVGGGYRVGWFWVGEWMQYTVNPEAGTYAINLRISTSAAGATAVLSLNGTTIGSVPLPNTGGATVYQTVTLPDVAIQGGVQVLRVKVAGTAAYDLNWIDFVKTGP